MVFWSHFSEVCHFYQFVVWVIFSVTAINHCRLERRPLLQLRRFDRNNPPCIQTCPGGRLDLEQIDVQSPQKRPLNIHFRLGEVAGVCPSKKPILSPYAYREIIVVVSYFSRAVANLWANLLALNNLEITIMLAGYKLCCRSKSVWFGFGFKRCVWWAHFSPRSNSFVGATGLEQRPHVAT